MKLKRLQNLQKVFNVFGFIFFVGFIGVYKWKQLVNELHDKAKAEGKDNIWFAKKCIGIYLSVTFTTLVNIATWSTICYYLLDIKIILNLYYYPILKITDFITWLRFIVFV